MQREPRHVKVSLARNRCSSDGQEKRRDLWSQKGRNSRYVRIYRRRNAIHKVRIVCDSVNSPDVRCSRRFDDPVSFDACRDCFTEMRVWVPVGLIQIGELTDTAVAFERCQCGTKQTQFTGLDLNICRRVRVANYQLSILIRKPRCIPTHNNDYRGCRQSKECEWG